MLDAKTPIELLAGAVTSGGGNASALGDAYVFSSSPELLRFRALTKGGEHLHYACDDFARAKGSAAVPTLQAYVHASEPAARGAGGELVVPAGSVKVAPKFGRLVLVETVLPDGTCDPASALASTPLGPKAPDLLLLRKTFYSNRAFSRAEHNHEGPQRLTPRVVCDPTTHGCRRYGHVGADKGDAVLPLRVEGDDDHLACVVEQEVFR